MTVLDSFRLDGEVALITGAGSGIGRIAAHTLSEAGATVAVTDIDRAKADAVVAEVVAAGGRARAWRLDVASEEAITATIEAVVAALGRLDVLINNVGVSVVAPAETFLSADWHRVLNTNLTATFVACREAGRHMLTHGGGRIINMASVVGLGGGGVYPSPAYASAKGAIVNLTRELAAEWSARGVRVNAIAPGLVETPMTERLRNNEALATNIIERTPMRRHAQPEEMAGGIVYLASRASSMVTGHTLVIDGGIMAV
jgi:NAD(P)-dependent dehydrogenase (short-subunit alcohol dehydrogenase family)